MDIAEYLELSEKTLSEQFHLDDSDVKAALEDTISDFLEVATRLDMLKKVVYYGKDKSVLGDGLRAGDTAGYDRELTLKEQKLLHAAIGIATESGEILEQVHNSLKAGREVDSVNISEESSDVMWYYAIFGRELKLDFHQGLRNNIDKLRKRFGAKFNTDGALNRDLDAERKELKKGI
jgi:NTP pyrophosphatase (non-canonical NTP hydrolase)